MSRHGLRRLLLVLPIALAFAVSAQPALADTELGHRGTVGVHSLRDTSEHPGATCKYRYLPAYGYGQLRRIEVRPPQVKAVSGKSHQLVGWRFTIQRKEIGLFGSTHWHKRYTSPEQITYTDDAHNAAFAGMFVRVKVPFGPATQDAIAIYRVIVKLFWHRADGEIAGVARHRVDFYNSVMSSGERNVQQGACGDYWSPAW